MYSEKPKLHERIESYKQGDLRAITLAVTAHCNSNCPHCYAAPFQDVKPIPLEDLNRVLDESYYLGVFQYVLQGGEPLADPERLETVIQMVYPDETYINVFSNGWEMSLEKVKWLKELKVDKFTFSLDSGIEEEHDRVRGIGSFKKVSRAVDYVLDEGLVAAISIIATPDTLYSEGFKRAYDFALEKGIRLDVQIGQPTGKWEGRTDVLISPADAQYIKKLQSDSPCISTGEKMIKRDIYCGEDDHCPAGTESMYLSADGELLPCPFLQFSLGNVAAKSIKTMRDMLLQSQWFRTPAKNCLSGENVEFMNSYMMPYVGQPKPLNAYRVFNLEEME